MHNAVQILWSYVQIIMLGLFGYNNYLQDADEALRLAKDIGWWSNAF